jgi:hypothetical protein
MCTTQMTYLDRGADCGVSCSLTHEGTVGALGRAVVHEYLRDGRRAKELTAVWL